MRYLCLPNAINNIDGSAFIWPIVKIWAAIFCKLYLRLKSAHAYTGVHVDNMMSGVVVVVGGVVILITVVTVKLLKMKGTGRVFLFITRYEDVSGWPWLRERQDFRFGFVWRWNRSWIVIFFSCSCVVLVIIDTEMFFIDLFSKYWTYFHCIVWCCH